MLNKLAFRNAKRSFEDYLIYLMTMVFITALIFAFDSMIFSEAVQKICAEAEMMGIMIGAATFFIVLIIVWLVHYMMKFMAEKRSREFATYLLLGFYKKQIARLFFREMVLLGTAAFIMGLIPGIFLQQVVTTLIYAVVQLPYKVRIEWNYASFGMTAAVFFGSCLLALIRSRSRFRKMNIRDMMYLEKQNEEIKSGNRTGKRWMLWFSVLVIVLFGCMLCFGLFNQWNVYPLTAVLIAAVYMLYVGLSAFLADYIRKGRAGVYQGANIFLLRQLVSKIKTMQFTLGTLTVLFATALVGISSALMLNQFQNTQAQEKWPFDVMIYSDKTGDDFSLENNLIEKYALVKDELVYRIYQNGTDDCSRFFAEKAPWAKRSDYFQYDTYIRLGDYNRLREMLGLPKVSLEPGEYLIHTKRRLKEEAQSFVKKPLSIGGENYGCAGIRTEPFEQSGHNGADFLLVVPDETALQMKPYYSLMAAQIKGSLPEEFADWLYELREDADGQEDDMEKYIQHENYEEKLERGVGSDNIYVSSTFVFLRENDTREMKFLLSTLMFPLFYIGMVFLCVALTVLAVQQISDAGKYRYRYRLLWKLGLRQKETDRLILRQLLIYYMCPFGAAVLLSGGITGYVSINFTKATGIPAPVWSYFGTAVLLFGLVYLIYFTAAYVEFRRNILYGQRDMS